MPPADIPGSVRVGVQRPDGGGRADIDDGYTTSSRWRSTASNPLVDQPGGIPVSIFGQGFDSGTTVRFAGPRAEQLEVSDDGESMTVRLPPGLPGSVAVELRGLNGRVNVPEGFIYAEDLLVAEVLPRFGSVAG